MVYCLLGIRIMTECKTQVKFREKSVALHIQIMYNVVQTSIQLVWCMLYVIGKKQSHRGFCLYTISLLLGSDIGFYAVKPVAMGILCGASKLHL